jgi:hypothetical protein
MGETLRCFATLVLTSVPLAVAAITSSALSLFHDLDGTMMILI